ncbi:sigma-70 family RNA polymerase sigma factor [Pseudosulfitobacter sp. DSM 107133]|uniref:sigma-70 family RNA polymerase sigma factor n=1 Tax=Pseudosulfitobacter sp. DSM 107133 TaxID=2883100 RepID=UPI0013B40900|nr:sigma-70 family RNA polymerase sigma factor [Pseudosulfitobacter sp. DSM 107133]
MTRQKLLRHLIDEREMLLCDAMRILGNRDRAEDVVQDAAMRCLSSKAIGADIASPRGFLRRIVRNLALDHRRREISERVTPLELDDELLSDQPSAERQLQDRQALVRLASGMVALPAREADILCAHRLRVESQKDIARRYGLSAARINGIIAHTQARLAAYVDAAEPSGAVEQGAKR